MSTPVDTSLTDLKAITAQIMAIISGARHIPPGQSHFALTAQVGALVADIVKEYAASPYIPGLVLSCSKELIRVRGMTPQVWLNWHSIGYDDHHLKKHPWRSKVPFQSTFHPPPVIARDVPGSSTNPTTEYRDKGKGKAVVVDSEPEAEGSRKRKSPMIPEVSSQPPKSAMKSHKRRKSTRIMKSKALVESEDDDEPIIKPVSRGVLEVVLPPRSKIVARTPNSPRSPWVPTKKPRFPGVAPEVVEPSQPTPNSPVEAPAVVEIGDILIPWTEQPMPCLQQARMALCNSFRQEDQNRACRVLLLDQEDQVHLRRLWDPPPTRTRAPSTTRRARSRTPSKAPSKAPPASQLKAELAVSLGGLSGTPAVTAATTPKDPDAWSQQDHHCHQGTCTCTLHRIEFGIPRAALGCCPCRISMAWQLRFGMLQLELAIIEACMKSSTGTPHFHFLTFPANATSLLLDQSVPMSSSPPESTLPPLIDLSTTEMTPTPPKFEDASSIEGLLFESNEVVDPEGPHTPGENVDPGDLGNLVPEYDF
ncbi:hypothetical protein DFH29DRAFT_1002113 [Suillus ampliporus]|nr:hypothetical protein DFH29DRAFT_1002113 [Suillus ampliporus]